ncbi:MAG: NUDIX hydrolase [Oscillospiraceae bacterium]|nr:NUDIX hydrolase [Oscillospiraceae bacterium]
MKQFPTHIVAVFGIVENDRGEVLLLKSRHRNDAWHFPGGQVEVGEDLMQALQREAMEECGIEITVGRLFCVSSNTSSYSGYGDYDHVPTKVMLGFACSYAGGDLRDSDETHGACWVPKEQPLTMFAEPFLTQYKAYLAGSVQYHAYATKPEFELQLKREI